MASKTPRKSETYRGARRNAARATGAIMVRRGPKAKKRTLAPRVIGLNRSDRWPRAMSYAHARENGPSSEMVR